MLMVHSRNACCWSVVPKLPTVIYSYCRNRPTVSSAGKVGCEPNAEATRQAALPNFEAMSCWETPLTNTGASSRKVWVWHVYGHAITTGSHICILLRRRSTIIAYHHFGPHAHIFLSVNVAWATEAYLVSLVLIQIYVQMSLKSIDKNLSTTTLSGSVVPFTGVMMTIAENMIECIIVYTVDYFCSYCNIHIYCILVVHCVQVSP